MVTAIEQREAQKGTETRYAFMLWTLFHHGLLRRICAWAGIGSQVAIAKSLLEGLRLLGGAAPVLGRMKELWGLLHADFEGGPARLKAIQRNHTLADYERAVGMLTSWISRRCYLTQMSVPDGPM